MKSEFVIGVLVDLAQCCVTAALAVVLAVVGWRLTNVRAGRDLFLEEVQKVRQICNELRAGLRVATQDEVKLGKFVDQLEELGTRLGNCRRILEGIGKGGRCAWKKTLDRDYKKLRRTASNDQLDIDLVAVEGIELLGFIEDAIIDLSMSVNR